MKGMNRRAFIVRSGAALSLSAAASAAALDPGRSAKGEQENVPKAEELKPVMRERGCASISFSILQRVGNTEMGYGIVSVAGCPHALFAVPLHPQQVSVANQVVRFW